MVVLSSTTTHRLTATMPLDEFMRRLELPRRPVTVDIDWSEWPNPADVTIYLESE